MPTQKYIEEKHIDEPLEDSRDELSQDIDAAKLEATLGDHENRLAALLLLSTHIAERLDDIETSLTEPRKKDPNDPLDCGECWSPRYCAKHETPIVYRCRFTKKGRYVRVRGEDFIDEFGRGNYSNGDFSTDNQFRQGVLSLWPEALEPVPAEADDELDISGIDGAAELAKLENKAYRKGRKEGNILAIIMVILTALLMCGLSFLI